MLHSIRAFDVGEHGQSSDLIAALDWVLSHHTAPAIVNLSLDGPPDDDVDDAVRALMSNTIFVVAAAGNEFDDACNHSPGRVAGVVTVGSSTQNDTMDPPSNWGSCVSLFAPGQNIVSANPNNDMTDSSPPGSLANSGTSFAVAHVAGVAALYLSNLGFAPISDVRAFVLQNASVVTVDTAHPSSPTRLLYSRWTPHRFLYESIDCYDEFGTSCYSRTWRPACPARPVELKDCSSAGQGSFCYSIVSAAAVEEYQCSGSN